ncbi:MAG: MaoC protein dehydratase [Nocardioidaceae bacterium]|nr:MaoC protein dehydratase [Nocardioidaceae bacterium]
MPNLVGTLVDRVDFTVEQGKILELARATGATSPDHPAGLATATHVVVAGHHRDQQGFVAALGLDITRVVVGSVSWEYARALRVGDSLVGTRAVVADQTREGRRGTNRLVTLETEYVVGDEVVVRQREVLIERGTS